MKLLLRGWYNIHFLGLVDDSGYFVDTGIWAFVDGLRVCFVVYLCLHDDFGVFGFCRWIWLRLFAWLQLGVWFDLLFWLELDLILFV